MVLILPCNCYIMWNVDNMTEQITVDAMVPAAIRVCDRIDCFLKQVVNGTKCPLADAKKMSPCSTLNLLFYPVPLIVPSAHFTITSS